MRFTIEVDIDLKAYLYSIAFELPEGFKELRVFDERLSANGALVFSRSVSQVELARPNRDPAAFTVDWHFAALPIIQEASSADPLSIFKRWLSGMLLLSPMPDLSSGDSQGETLEPNPHVTNLGEWFTGLLATSPAGYSTVENYLKQFLPDLKGILNPSVGPDARSLVVQFAVGGDTVPLPFKVLSAGEKCLLISALVVAAAEHNPPTFCFWDEPDNHLAISEVGPLILALRQVASGGNQLIVTSHNAEAIRRFSEENTFVFSRKSHLEPTTVKPLSDFGLGEDLIDALIEGEVSV
jgi:hypothetical protein